VKELVKEQLTQFPDLDYLFLEFEGLRSHVCEKLYETWAPEHGYPDAANVHYHSEKVARCARLGIHHRNMFFW
jgi:hypothetical protein